MKRSMFQIGEKISTVLNWPQLMPDTVPMHVLLEIIEGGIMLFDKYWVPNTKAIGISPIPDQKQIKELLQRNKKYLPNRLRLRAQELHDELAQTFEALDLVQKNTVDVAATITEQATAIQKKIDREKVLRNFVPFTTNPNLT